MNDDAQKYVEAARRIQRATTPALVAHAAAQAAQRADAAVQAAVEACLQTLALSLSQAASASPEVANDLRIDTRRKLARLLGGDVETARHVAELAVQAVASQAGAMAPGGHEAGAPLAYAGLSGPMLVSASAREFAFVAGVDEAALVSLLERAAAPVRRACACAGVCSVGRLRYTARTAGLAATASLQSAQGSPQIRLLLHFPERAPADADGPVSTPSYPARVLRRLVS